MHLLARYIRVNSITKGRIGWPGKWLAGFVSGVIVVAVVVMALGVWWLRRRRAAHASTTEVLPIAERGGSGLDR